MSLGVQEDSTRIFLPDVSPELPSRASPKCRFIRFWRGREPWRARDFVGEQPSGGAVRHRSHWRQRPWPDTVWRFADGLRDFDTVAAGPFDDAAARLQLVDRPSGRRRAPRARVAPLRGGPHLGAHLHNGPCRPGRPRRCRRALQRRRARRPHSRRRVERDGGLARLHGRRQRCRRLGSRPCSSPCTPARGRSSCTPPPPTPRRASPGLAWPASRWSGDAASGRARRPGWPRLGTAGPFFMRLLATTPEFTWDGTLAILGPARCSAPGWDSSWALSERPLAVVAWRRFPASCCS